MNYCDCYGRIPSDRQQWQSARTERMYDREREADRRARFTEHIPGSPPQPESEDDLGQPSVVGNGTEEGCRDFGKSTRDATEKARERCE